MAFVRNRLIQQSKQLISTAKRFYRQTHRLGLGCPVAYTKWIHNANTKSIIPSMQVFGGQRNFGTKPVLDVNVKNISSQNETLDITWDHGVTDKFPFVWLRDCCLCDDCYVFTSKARKLVMQNVNPEIRPSDVTVDHSTMIVTITWQDGHVSKFGFEWLHQRAFNNRNRRIRQKWLQPAHELWGRNDMEDKIPTDTMDNVLNDDNALFRFLYGMEKKGIYLLKGAPLEVGQLEKLGERVAFIRTTNYGVTFHVQVKADASNAAYTSAALGLHTDVPFCKYIPGIWLTHCIKQYSGEGGSSTVADGFNVAEKMRRERPDLFKILTDTPIDFYDVGTDHYKFYLLRQGPTIKLDQNGSVNEVIYNNQDRDYYLDIAPERVKPLYTALRYWDDMLNREENYINYKLQEGDIIALDNNRVLHGRTGFTSQGDTPQDMSRHLEGIYLDWDEVRSKRRVLQYDLGLDEHPPIH